MIKNKKIHFWAGDIETSGGLTGQFLLGGVYDGRKYFEFEKEADFMNFVLNLDRTIFFHLLDFDIRFVIDWCQRKGIAIKTMPVMAGEKKVIEWKINKAIFRDSFILTQESLRELAKSFKLKTHKLEMRNYQNLRKSAKLKRYLKNDVVILHRIMAKFYDFAGWENFQKRTIASLSLEKFKEIDESSYNRIVEHPIYRKDEEFLRQGYFAAYYKVFNSEIKNKDKKILKIDVNSYYANMMQDNMFPWGKILKPQKVLDIMQLFHERKLGIIQAKAIVPKKLKFGFLPIKTERGVDYPTRGTIKGTWATPEIIFAQKLGYRFYFEKAIFFPFQDYLFRKYINYLARIKEKSSGAKRTIAKNLMVSLYGKFAQRRNISLFKQIEIPIPGKFYLDDNLSIVEEKRYIRTPYSHPEISIFTTAYARIWMYEFCQKISFENIYVILNDSLILNDNLSEEFKRQWFHPDKIGKFKIVSQIEKGIVLGRGIYALKNINGTEIIKNQGGVKEYNKLLKFNDFEKIKKDKQRFWQQYSDIKRPRTIYSYLKGKSKLKEEQINKRKIKMGLDKN